MSVRTTGVADVSSQHDLTLSAYGLLVDFGSVVLDRCISLLKLANFFVSRRWDEA